jgi:hypothetical protein
VDNLRACYSTLKANKATGVDGVTKEQYGLGIGVAPSQAFEKMVNIEKMAAYRGQ